MGGSRKDREGEEALAAMVHTLGQEVVDKAVGVWLAKSHRERPRLFWAKPDSPARAGHYLAFVRQLSCVLCGDDPPNDPHHVGKHAMGRKTDDYRAIPLCRRCHDRLHSEGAAFVAHAERIDSKVADTLIKYLRIVEQT